MVVWQNASASWCQGHGRWTRGHFRIRFAALGALESLQVHVVWEEAFQPVFEPMNLRVAHVCPICTSMPVPMHPKLNGSFARNMCCMPDMWDKVMRCVRLVWLNVFDQKHPEMSPVAEVRADFEVFGTDFFWPCPSGNPYFDQIRGWLEDGTGPSKSKLIMEWP